MSQLLASDSQSIGVSASTSVPPVNTQEFRRDWLDLLAVQLIYLSALGLSRDMWDLVP